MSSPDLVILTAAARQTFVFKPAFATKDPARGTTLSLDPGCRLRAEKLGRVRNEDGDYHTGIRCPDLTAGAKVRKNRALGKIELKREAARVSQYTGEPMSPRELALWMCQHPDYGVKKGITWQLKGPDGSTLEIEDLESDEAVGIAAAVDGEYDLDPEVAYVYDKTHIYCIVCDRKVAKVGWLGHCKGRPHQQNLAAFKKKQAAA